MLYSLLFLFTLISFYHKRCRNYLFPLSYSCPCCFYFIIVALLISEKIINLNRNGRKRSNTNRIIVKTTTQPQHNPKTTPRQPNTIQRELGLTRLLVCTTTTTYHHHHPTTETLLSASEQYRPILG